MREEDESNIANGWADTEDKKLKPCPFCGSDAFTQIFDPHSHILDFVPDHPGSATVECPNCPCGIIVDGSLEEAIKIWNTRTPDQMLEELVMALEKLAILGNEPHPGSSIGNVIAQQALQKYQQSKKHT